MAVREALLNLLVHREYSFRASTFISIYTDRIEFTSIGGLVSGVTLKDVTMGISVCRNAKLAKGKQLATACPKCKQETSESRHCPS